MLIILDRDGVINQESNQYIKSPDEWIPISGSLEAIAKLKSAGFKVVVATNQSGIARGLYSEEILAKIHEKMAWELSKWGVALDGVFYCPHQPSDQCHCRKPQPGLLLAIGEQLKIDLTKAISIGDSLRDIQATLKVGAQPSLVLTGNGERTLSELKKVTFPVYDNLADAALDIIAQDIIS